MMKRILLVLSMISLTGISVIAWSYPISLTGKTLYAAYTYGKPAGKVLKVTYGATTFTTHVLPRNKKLTGSYQYHLNESTGIATLNLYPNQTNFNGAQQKLTFHFSSNTAADFTDKTLGTGALAGGFITFSEPRNAS